MSTTDTIAAFATPAQPAGVGVLRISGDEALGVLRALAPSLSEAPEPRRLHYVEFLDPRSHTSIDQGFAIWMPGPHTYTGEDVAELQCHGGARNMARVLRAVLAAGSRSAEPGEFTRRAYLNGRLDLAQAEGVLDVIEARTEAGLDTAHRQLSGALSETVEGMRSRLLEILGQIEVNIDFIDQDVPLFDPGDLVQDMESLRTDLRQLAASWEQGRIHREGLSIAIAGRPNAGKSSLFNALLRDSRAIVTNTPGTTRDYLEEHADLSGFPVVLVDTAGLCDTDDAVEREGVARSHERITAADLVIWLHDCTEAPTSDAARDVLPEGTCIDVLSKMDLSRDPGWSPSKTPALHVSSTTGEGLDALISTIHERTGLATEGGPSQALVTRARHRDALEDAADALQRASGALGDNLPLEIVAGELQLALEAIGRIVGRAHIEDVLDHIFSAFCLGK